MVFARGPVVVVIVACLGVEFLLVAPRTALSDQLPNWNLTVPFYRGNTTYVIQSIGLTCSQISQTLHFYPESTGTSNEVDTQVAPLSDVDVAHITGYASPDGNTAGYYVMGIGAPNRTVHIVSDGTQVDQPVDGIKLWVQSPQDGQYVATYLRNWIANCRSGGANGSRISQSQGQTPRPTPAPTPHGATVTAWVENRCFDYPGEPTVCDYEIRLHNTGPSTIQVQNLRIYNCVNVFPCVGSFPINQNGGPTVGAGGTVVLMMLSSPQPCTPAYNSDGSVDASDQHCQNQPTPFFNFSYNYTILQ